MAGTSPSGSLPIAWHHVDPIKGPDATEPPPALRAIPAAMKLLLLVFAALRFLVTPGKPGGGGKGGLGARNRTDVVALVTDKLGWKEAGLTPLSSNLK